MFEPPMTKLYKRKKEKKQGKKNGNRNWLVLVCRLKRAKLSIHCQLTWDIISFNLIMDLAFFILCNAFLRSRGEARRKSGVCRKRFPEGHIQNTYTL
jgi:hypothetical protein